MSWLSRIFVRNKATTTPNLADLVNEYGRVLGEGSSIERDASELPFPKETIRLGLLEAIKITSDSQMREQLKSGYVSLADFQDLKLLRNEGRPIQKVILDEAETLLGEIRALEL